MSTAQLNRTAAQINDDLALARGAAQTSGATFTGSIIETPVVANTGAVYAVNTANGTVFDLTLTANCTFTFSTPTSGAQFTLWLTQGTGGPFAVSWPSSIRNADGVAPQLTQTVGNTDQIAFMANGTYWIAAPGPSNLALY